MTQIIRPLRWGYLGAPLPEKRAQRDTSAVRGLKGGGGSPDNPLTQVERTALERIWPNMRLKFNVEEHRV